jgi:alkylation response protein AidB-like acyl-CoA dehydrogenase
MRFLLESEHNDLADTVDDMLGKADLPAAIRAWSDGDRTAALAGWQQLTETGITGLLVPDENGGSGAGVLETVVAIERIGKHALPGPVVETIAVAPALLTGTPAADSLAAIAEGELATVAFLPDAPYAVNTEAAASAFLVDGGTVYRGTAGAVRNSVDATRTVASLDKSDVITDAADVERAFNIGALATAAQLIGLGQRMLDIATEYAKTRKQYGVEIGSYQAIKHQLADVSIGIEMARPLIYGAALDLDGATVDPTWATRDVSAAKVACGDAAYRASRTGLQVLGAIGYTMEHDLSLYLTKTKALLTAWGTPAFHRRRLLTEVTA